MRPRATRPHHTAFFIAVGAYLVFCVVALLYVLVQWGTGALHHAADTITLGETSEVVSPPRYTTVTGALMVATGTIMHVRDGDTIEVRLNEADVAIRLIGVDTPESVHPNQLVECYGPEASRYTKQFLGEDVLLWRDPTQDAYDTYGRMLAYVGLPDGSIINALLLSTGHGKEYTYQRRNYLERDRYLELQREARSAKVGLWEACTSSL